MRITRSDTPYYRNIFNDGTRSAETVCARNARAAFDHPLAAEIPTVELLVEHADGGDETWVKENGLVVYPQVPADRPEP